MMKEVVVGGINIRGAPPKEVGKGGINHILIVIRMLELDQIGN